MIVFERKRLPLGAYLVGENVSVGFLSTPIINNHFNDKRSARGVALIVTPL